jgi:hypothetical protein
LKEVDVRIAQARDRVRSPSVDAKRICWNLHGITWADGGNALSIDQDRRVLELSQIVADERRRMFDRGQGAVCI